MVLPAHRHRPRLALPSAVRSVGLHSRGHRHHRLRATVPRARVTCRHPLGQRRTLRQPQCLVQPLQARGAVAAFGHRHRAHPARPSRQNGRHERMHLTLKKEATRSVTCTAQSAAPGAERCACPVRSWDSRSRTRSGDLVSVAMLDEIQPLLFLERRLEVLRATEKSCLAFLANTTLEHRLDEDRPVTLDRRSNSWTR